MVYGPPLPGDGASITSMAFLSHCSEDILWVVIVVLKQSVDTRGGWAIVAAAL